jgi:hypothetical protein
MGCPALSVKDRKGGEAWATRQAVPFFQERVGEKSLRTKNQQLAAHTIFVSD